MTKKDIYNMLMYGGIDKASYNTISGKIWKRNEENLRTCSLMGGYLMIMMLIYNLVLVFVNKRWNYDILLNAIFVLCFWSIYVALKIKAKKKKLNDTYTKYVLNLFHDCVYLYGINITLLDPDSPSVSFIVFIIMMPLLFTSRPYLINITTVFWSAVFVILSLIIRPTAVCQIDIINIIIYGIISIFLAVYFNDVKIRSIWLDYKNDCLANKDMLTGLLNRNCYEETINDFSLGAPRAIGCIYADVNGLHELNNTKGHAAGDKMLADIAALMQEVFGEDLSFRIGGDEFVAFSLEGTENIVRDKSEELNKKIEALSYHASIGYSFNSKINEDINSLIKDAEKMMYHEKELYYDRIGCDRRSTLKED